MTVTVAACQIPVDIDHPDPRAMVAAVRSAVDAGAQLVVLPELAMSGYCFASAEEALAVAEPLNGPTVKMLCELSAELGCVIVSGLCERDPDGAVFNSAVVIEAGQVIDVYRKVHLWGREPEFFAAGERRPVVVSTAVGRIAVMICYDLEFPEWVRLAAEAGAEIIAAPVNWPLDAALCSDPPIEVIKAQALAAVYRVSIVVADRCGIERGQDWIGGSIVCDVTGQLLASAPDASRHPAESALLLAELDPAAARDKAIGEHNDAFADRRPELYR